MVGERGEMDACMHGLLFSLLSERQSPPSCAHHSVLVLTTLGSHGGPVNRDDAAECCPMHSSMSHADSIREAVCLYIYLCTCRCAS